MDKKLVTISAIHISIKLAKLPSMGCVGVSSNLNLQSRQLEQLANGKRCGRPASPLSLNPLSLTHPLNFSPFTLELRGEEIKCLQIQLDSKINFDLKLLFFRQ